MKTYLVNFNLPFRIALNDSSLSIKKEDINANMLWFKRNGVVSKHRNALFSKSNAHWVNEDVSGKVVIEGGDAQKYWIGEVNNSGDSNPMGYIDQAIHGESAFHFLYSEVFIYIQYSNADILDVKDIIYRALEITNWLIYEYRIETSDIAVFTISLADLEFVNLFEIINNDFDIYAQKAGVGKIELKKINTSFNWEELKAIKPFSFNFSVEKAAQIIQKVKKEYRSPAWFEILLEAKEQNIKFKNYDLSIVLLETSFEVFIDYFLLQILGNKPKEEIDRCLEDSFLNKLRQQIPKYLQKEIKEGIKEYDDWHLFLYKLRNEIIHDGY